MTLCVPRCIYFPLLPLLIEPIPADLLNTIRICVKCLVDYGYSCARAKLNALFQVKSELQVIKCLMIQTLKKSSNVSDNLKGNIPAKSSTAFAHLHQIPNNGINY
jgi:hypothetical protein